MTLLLSYQPDKVYKNKMGHPVIAIVTWIFIEILKIHLLRKRRSFWRSFKIKQWHALKFAQNNMETGDKTPIQNRICIHSFKKMIQFSGKECTTSSTITWNFAKKQRICCTMYRNIKKNCSWECSEKQFNLLFIFFKQRWNKTEQVQTSKQLIPN